MHAAVVHYGYQTTTLTQRPLMDTDVLFKLLRHSIHHQWFYTDSTEPLKSQIIMFFILFTQVPYAVLLEQDIRSMSRKQDNILRKQDNTLQKQDNILHKQDIRSISRKQDNLQKQDNSLKQQLVGTR